MNTNSNTYTIIYSAIIVIIVAFLLAFVSTSLREKQEANVKLDTKKQILNSLNLRDLNDDAAEAKYKEVVKSEDNVDGQKVFSCEHTSITTARRQVLVPRSRTLVLGRTSSRERRFSRKALRTSPLA